MISAPNGVTSVRRWGALFLVLRSIALKDAGRKVRRAGAELSFGPAANDGSGSGFRCDLIWYMATGLPGSPSDVDAPDRRLHLLIPVISGVTRRKTLHEIRLPKAQHCTTRRAQSQLSFTIIGQHICQATLDTSSASSATKIRVDSISNYRRATNAECPNTRGGCLLAEF